LKARKPVEADNIPNLMLYDLALKLSPITIVCPSRGKSG
jgi:hypothetical protein